MQESDTYSYIPEEGGIRSSKRWILLQGETRFGTIDAANRAESEAITDLAQLV